MSEKKNVLKLLTSSIGLKMMMGISGLVMVGFAFGHLAGNLQVFIGKEAFNTYAHFLKSIPELLWPVRIFLIACLLIHFGTGFKLRRMNKSARPQGYHAESTVTASLASRTMLQTGLVIFIFIILHLLHFTFGSLQPEFYGIMDDKNRMDVYAMLIHGFQDPLYSLIYIFGMICLGTHLSHAIGSMVKTAGFWGPQFTPAIDRISLVAGWGLALGFISIPVSVLIGILHL